MIKIKTLMNEESVGLREQEAKLRRTIEEYKRKKQKCIELKQQLSEWRDEYERHQNKRCMQLQLDLEDVQNQISTEKQLIS